ncbi:MAG: 4'-phosphopantetheinyl transferase superfamily protein [Bacteroidetes bacterium]|nr:MAG: 4'-phosphopantetheinyl transferase superfamily protein [Bacteroidota bacterium]
MDFCIITKYRYTFFYTRLSTLLPSEEKALLEELPSHIQKKAFSFVKESDKKAYLIGRMLLKTYLPNWEHIQYNAWGKPYLQDASYHFNLSHSGDCVALALSNQGEIGADIEVMRPISHDNFTHCFSSKEWENIINPHPSLNNFYKAWTQKESIIKADGRGLSIELQNVVIEEQEGYIKDTLPLRYSSDFIEISEDCIGCVSYPI